MQTFHINANFLLKYKLPQLFRSGGKIVRLVKVRKTGPK